jgi:16S rRNA (cytosine967-C5)-methyltransferase
LHERDIVKNFSNPLISGLQEKEMLPLPKVEGDDRSQARALATLYSHPVVSVYPLQLFLHHC